MLRPPIGSDVNWIRVISGAGGAVEVGVRRANEREQIIAQSAKLPIVDRQRVPIQPTAHLASTRENNRALASRKVVQPRTELRGDAITPRCGSDILQADYVVRTEEDLEELIARHLP